MTPDSKVGLRRFLFQCIVVCTLGVSGSVGLWPRCMPRAAVVGRTQTIASTGSARASHVAAWQLEQGSYKCPEHGALCISATAKETVLPGQEASGAQRR